MTHSPVTTIAYDLGGVLFSEGKQAAIKQLSQEHGYNPALIWQILTSEESHALRRGDITAAVFWQWVDKNTPSDYDTQRIRQVWYDSYQLDYDIYHLLQQLRQQQYQCIAFSGNIEERIQWLENTYHFQHLFDAEVYSYQHGANKEEMVMTEALLKTANVPAEHIVHIDDAPDKMEAACQAGIHVIGYTPGESEALKEHLRHVGVVLT